MSEHVIWPPQCPTCGGEYRCDDLYSVCSNAFHCCRDCVWVDGRREEMCPLCDHRGFMERVIRECPHDAGARYRAGLDRAFFCVLCPDESINIPYRGTRPQQNISWMKRISSWWTSWRQGESDK